MAHTYNPSYSGGRDQEDLGSKLPRQIVCETLCWKKPITKKGWCSGSRCRLSSNPSTTHTHTHTHTGKERKKNCTCSKRYPLNHNCSFWFPTRSTGCSCKRCYCQSFSNAFGNQQLNLESKPLFLPRRNCLGKVSCIYYDPFSWGVREWRWQWRFLI
jgi:hypothetical protein